MTYCGSDIRLIGVEAKRNPYAHLLRISSNDPKYDNGKKWMMRWQNIWVHKFTAIRNLYDSAVEIIPKKKIFREVFLNNIGAGHLSSTDPATLSTRNRPLLVHAPSHKGIKGTEYVTSTIEALQRRGLEFDYMEIHNVPNADAQKIYRECDIIIDQFLVGGIGTLAFEAFHFGKPLVSFVLPEIIEREMSDCPVWNANIDNLADRLEELILNPGLRLELGRKGIAFNKKYLDVEAIQKAVVELYTNL